MKKIVIIGGGIASLVLGYNLAQYDNVELIFIKSSSHHNASINNQSWLQSGMLYNFDVPDQYEVAQRCYEFGPRLLDMLGKRMNYKTGIMALPNQTEAIKKLSLLHHVDKHDYTQYLISNNQIRNILGNDFIANNFSPNTAFIRTPDQPFQEGELMRICEIFLKTSKNCEIIPGDASIIKSLSLNGYTIKVDNREFTPDYTFVLAGMNTKNLLQPLGVDHLIEIKIRRCILLKTLFEADLNTATFMDTINHLNINTITNDKGSKIHLLGDSRYTEIIDHYDFSGLSKNATDIEMEGFYDNYFDKNKYQKLRSRILRNASPSDFNVCYKVEGNNGYLPWLYNIGDITNQSIKNMTVGGAGKATLAYYVAEKMIADSKLDGERILPKETKTTTNLSDVTHWTEK